MLTFSQAFTEKFSIVKMMELNRDPRSYEGGALKKKKNSVVFIPQFSQEPNYFTQSCTVIYAQIFLLCLYFLQNLDLLSFLLEWPVIYSFSRGSSLLRSDQGSNSRGTSSFLFDFFPLIQSQANLMCNIDYL